MSEIIWSLNPENKTLEQLMAYLREQLHKQLEYAGIQYSLQLTDEGKDIILSNEQRRNILLATKEIVNNAIKYSNAKNISISIQLNKNILQGHIADDGCGFDAGTHYKGNGLKNIRYRIEELQGKLEIHSEINRGSTFHYTIPLS
jgi:signal transduction histidine kinase